LGAVARDALPVLETVVLQDLEPAIIERAARLEPSSLRTLDAIHLASALGMGVDLEAFVTYDARLAAAARGAGLTVVSPGAQLTGAPRDE
jgi:predicted nucleic acid-binding protein